MPARISEMKRPSSMKACRCASNWGPQFPDPRARRFSFRRVNAARFGHGGGVTLLKPFELALQFVDARYCGCPLGRTNTVCLDHRVGVTLRIPFELALQFADARYRGIPLCLFLLEHEGTKLANRPQAFPEIRCVARIGRAMHQLCDCRVHIEAMAEKRSEMLGQLDGAIHQSV